MIEKIVEFIKILFSFWTGQNYAELQQANKSLDAVKQKEEVKKEVASMSSDDKRNYLSGGDLH